MIEGLYRRSLLAVADAPPVARFVRSQGWRLGVGRFVAGESLPDALDTAARLEADGLPPILDLLGEFVDDPAVAEAMTLEIIETVDAAAARLERPYLSVKPTQLGLGIDEGLALANARRVLERAQPAGARVCLDMEDHPHVDGTLRLLDALRREGFDHASTVLQSYLRRSMDDLERVASEHPGVSLRIVKGAYREPPEVAFPDKRDVDERYREMVVRGLELGARIAVATHDESILRETIAYARGAGLGPDRVEFQMLYGVKPALQRELVARGHTVRVYLPFGRDWYGYFSRRLAERPANLAFIARGLFG